MFKSVPEEQQLAHLLNAQVSFFFHTGYRNICTPIYALYKLSRFRRKRMRLLTHFPPGLIHSVDKLNARIFTLIIIYYVNIDSKTIFNFSGVNSMQFYFRIGSTLSIIK